MLTLRYEDLRQSPLPTLMQLTSYILPPSQLPPLSQIACALTLDESREAYHSHKSSVFSSWEKFTPEARRELVQIAQEGWCRFGYEEAARTAGLTGLDPLTSVDCKRTSIEALNSSREGQ